ncbi:MAG: hypothetical protein HY761_01095 [Candidatus Omnitrophica bacterium]|nr:hypothetical protein [Candidatus Omnitrophota bacterium]
MKKIFVALLVIVIINFLCFTQLPSVRAEEARTFIGTIESFRPVMGRPPKWYFARFTAVNDIGEKKEFWILGASGASPTSVTDFDGKPMDKPGYNHRPQVGKKVEVKYSTAGNGRNEAISIRYVPADYVPQVTAPAAQPGLNSTSSAIAVSEAGNNIFVGKVVKGGVTFSLKCPYRFVIVIDNGEKKDVWIPRDNMRITELNGNSVYGAPPRAGRKMEIKYLTGDNGQYEAVSMHYVPEDYVQKSTTPVLLTQTPATTTEQEVKFQGNVFVGKLEKATPVFHHIDKSQPRCKLLVVADNGEQKLFFVSGLCPVIDASGKDISQTWGNIASLLKNGERLEVKYSVIRNGNYITNGQNGADSIRCLD